jgi:hypothetical protein
LSKLNSCKKDYDLPIDAKDMKKLEDVAKKNGIDP